MIRSIDLIVWVILEVWKLSIPAGPQVQWRNSAEVRRPRSVASAEVRSLRSIAGAQIRMPRSAADAEVRRQSIRHSAWVHRQVAEEGADVRKCYTGKAADFLWNLFSCPYLLLLCSGFLSDVWFLILSSDNSILRSDRLCLAPALIDEWIGFIMTYPYMIWWTRSDCWHTYYPYIDLVIGWFRRLIDYVLQWYLWVQYENWMKCGLSDYVLCFRCIQSENVWNVVPGGENIVGRYLRTSILASTRTKGEVAPF